MGCIDAVIVANTFQMVGTLVPGCLWSDFTRGINERWPSSIWFPVLDGGIALDQPASSPFDPLGIGYSLEIDIGSISDFISNCAYIIPTLGDIGSWSLR